jgi:hypothetical protein
MLTPLFPTGASPPQGNTTCLYQNANTSFTSLVGTAILLKNTNSFSNPGFSPDLQFDTNGNVYFATQVTSGNLNLLKVNAATGVATAVGSGGTFSKFDVAGSNLLSSGVSLNVAIPSPAQVATYSFTNLTFANGTTIKISNAPYLWSYVGSDGAFRC